MQVHLILVTTVIARTLSHFGSGVYGHTWAHPVSLPSLVPQRASSRLVRTCIHIAQPVLIR